MHVFKSRSLQLAIQPCSIVCYTYIVGLHKAFVHSQGIAIVEAHFRSYQAMFPNALVEASTYDAWWEKLELVKGTLPTFTGEIGDTWIFGVSSDPWKVAAMRAMQRVVASCTAAAAAPTTFNATSPRANATPEAQNRASLFGAVGESEQGHRDWTANQRDTFKTFLLLNGKHTWGRGCGQSISNIYTTPLFFKMAQNLDLRCVLVPAPWVLGPKHVSNPE